MSHDTSGRDSGGMTTFTLPFLFVHREIARGVTDRGVGSGALLGAWPCSTINAANRDAARKSHCTREAEFFTADIRTRVFSTEILPNVKDEPRPCLARLVRQHEA